MKLRVLEASEPAKWNAALDETRWSHSDIYFTSPWYRSWQRAGFGEGRALLAQADGVSFFYPFLFRSIGGDDDADPRFDVETAYGYGGVITGGNLEAIDDNVIAEFNSAVDRWMIESGVVCEFLRLTPELNDHRVRALDYARVRDDLYLDISGRTTDEVWASLHRAARGHVRKARKNGLELVIDCELESLRDFVSVYGEAAQRIGMDTFYHFDQTYFDAFSDELRGRSLVLLVRRGEEVLAASLWLLGEETLHYYLAATRSGATRMSCADLFIWGAIEFTIETGIPRVHLGGGLGRERDSLFDFKSKYANREAGVFIATGVHDHERYEELVAGWRSRFPHLVEKHGHKLLCYRVGD